MSEEPRPGTVGSLDRRVERLEVEFGSLRDQMGSLSSDIALVKQEQQHNRELMNAHFSTIEHSIAAMLAETKLIGTRFDTQAAAGAEAASDPSRTAAGRALLARLESLEQTRREVEALQDFRVSAEATIRTLKFLFGGSVLAAVATVVALAATLSGR